MNGSSVLSIQERGGDELKLCPRLRVEGRRSVRCISVDDSVRPGWGF